MSINLPPVLRMLNSQELINKTEIAIVKLDKKLVNLLKNKELKIFAYQIFFVPL